MSFRCPKCHSTYYSESSFESHLRYTHGTSAAKLLSERRSSGIADSMIDSAIGFGAGMLVDSLFDSFSSGSSDSGSSYDWSGDGGMSGGGGADGSW